MYFYIDFNVEMKKVFLKMLPPHCTKYNFEVESFTCNVTFKDCGVESFEIGLKQARWSQSECLYSSCCTVTGSL